MLTRKNLSWGFAKNPEDRLSRDEAHILPSADPENVFGFHK